MVCIAGIWRGVNFGNSAPSVQGLLSYNLGPIEIGTYGAITLNGEKDGYGNTLEIFGTFKFEQFSLTIDDYFFFEKDDSQ